MGGIIRKIASVVIGGVVGFLTGGPIGAVIGAGLAIASQVLQPKTIDPQSTAAIGLGAKQQAILRTIRSSIAPRQIVYGETVVSGPIVAAFSTGNNNKYLHLFVCLAGHEVEEIGDIWLDDTLSTDAKFTGIVNTYTHTGTASQAADANAVADITEWTTAHQLKGIAYIYARFEQDVDVWVSGIPNIKARVKGKKVYDTRTSTTIWSDNPILCQRDFLTTEFGASTSDVDDTITTAQANICDEDVSLLVSASITAFADAGGGQITVTSAGHGLSNNTRIEITGTSDYDDEYNISNVDADAFEITDTFVATDTGTWTLSITAFADGGSGKVIVSCASHGLSNNDTVTIAGTTNYNGDEDIDNIELNSFEITHSWDGDDATGTISAATQKRYTCNGVWLKNQTAVSVMEELKTSCAGTNIRQQGLYKLYAGAYTTPTVTLTEDDLRGAIQVQTKDSRKDLFNAVKGVFVDSKNGHLPTNFPPQTNSTYETEDGGLQIFKTIDLPFTDNSIRSQRLAKIQLKRGRQGVKVIFPAKITAYPLAAWETVYLTISQLSWSAKSFRILSWELSAAGGIDLVLQEEISGDYTWASSEGQAVVIPPDMPISDITDIGAPTTPTGLTATARRLEIELTWTDNASTDISGYDIQRADDSGFTTNLTTLSEGHKGTYCIDDLGSMATQRYYRIRAVDKNGNVSSYTSGVNATTAGIDTEEIVNEAITVNGASANIAAAYGSGTTWTDSLSVAITTDGGTPVLLIGKHLISADTYWRTVESRIIHSGTSTVIDISAEIATFAENNGMTVANRGYMVWNGNVGATSNLLTISLVGIYIPVSSGSHTFKSQFRLNGTGIPRVLERSLVAIELKK